MLNRGGRSRAICRPRFGGAPIPPRSGSQTAPIAAAFALLAALLAGCGCAGREALEIDLARPSACRVRGAEAAAGSGSARVLAQADTRPIDCFLRLPAESALLFELPPSVTAGDAWVSVATDSGEQVLEPVRVEDQTWRAELGGFDGEVVRLRFGNRTGGVLTWGGPRVVGSEEFAEPLLPPPRREGEAPNVLLYVIGALRADRLSLYGYEHPTSPRLEELARRGVVFERAYSTAPATLSAVSSLLTSVYPSQVRGRLRSSPDGIAHTLAESFQRSGYATAAFQANYALVSSLGFARGFDVYEIVTGHQVEGSGGARADLLHAEVFQWLSTSAATPFFLYVQSLDLHDLDVPRPGFSRSLGGSEHSGRSSGYDEAVAHVDHELGALINALADLGLRESTTIVITADHGKSLGEARRRGLSLHDERVHIPLIISPHWDVEPTRVDEVVSLLDVGPTVLDLAGIGTPAQFQGRSLLRPLARHLPRAAGGEIEDREWFVREGPWKLVADRERAHLFRIAADPAEAEEASGRHPVRGGYLARLLWERFPGYRDPELRALPVDRGLDADERRDLAGALHRLGYSD